MAPAPEFAVPLRILYVTSLFPLPTAPNRGLFVSDQAALLEEVGHRVRVIAPRAWMPRVWEDRDPNFHGVRRAPERFAYEGLESFAPFYGRLPAHVWPALPLITLRALADRALAWLHPFAPDVVHCHTLYPVAALGAELARRLDVPLVGTVHGWDFDGALPHPRLGASERRLARGLDVLLVPNGRHRDLGIELGLSPEQVAVQPCHPHVKAAFRGRFGPPVAGHRRGPLRLLFPSSPTRKEKDFPLFQATCAALAARGWQVSHETFGGITREEVWSRIGRADVMVMTSEREGSPQVTKEALVIGTRISAVRVGDLASYLPEGTVAQARTPESLADAVEHAASLPEQAWVLPERYRPETVRAGLEQAYARAAQVHAQAENKG